MQMQRVIRLSYQAEPSQAYAMELNLSFSFKTLFQFKTRFLFNGFFKFFQQKKNFFFVIFSKTFKFQSLPFSDFQIFIFCKVFDDFSFFDFRHSQN